MKRVLKIVDVVLTGLVIINKWWIFPIKTQFTSGRYFPYVQHIDVPVVIIHVIIGVEMRRYQRIKRTGLAQVVILQHIQFRPVMSQSERQAHHIVEGVFDIEDIFDGLHITQRKYRVVAYTVHRGITCIVDARCIRNILPEWKMVIYAQVIK